MRPNPAIETDAVSAWPLTRTAHRERWASRAKSVRFRPLAVTRVPQEQAIRAANASCCLLVQHHGQSGYLGVWMSGLGLFEEGTR